jgi:hypothetical protein
MGNLKGKKRFRKLPTRKSSGSISEPPGASLKKQRERGCHPMDESIGRNWWVREAKAVMEKLPLETISKFAWPVTPAKAGVQENPKRLDSRACSSRGQALRGNDDERSMRHFDIDS